MEGQGEENTAGSSSRRDERSCNESLFASTERCAGNDFINKHTWCPLDDRQYNDAVKSTCSITDKWYLEQIAARTCKHKTYVFIQHLLLEQLQKLTNHTVYYHICLSN